MTQSKRFHTARARRIPRNQTEAQMSNMSDVEREAWLAIRKEAGRHIDPETAEVDWDFAQTFDPYGVDPDLPEEYQQVGREYFARSPGSDIWVWFGDLPDAARDALISRSSSEVLADDEGTGTVLVAHVP